MSFLPKLLLPLALMPVACESADQRQAVAQEEDRYRAEFPGRELLVAKLETLTATNALVPTAADGSYALDERVGCEGDYYVYTVFTPHGTYTVKGLFALTKHCREARVIEMLLSSPFSAELVGKMGDYFSPRRAPRADMLVAPVDSIQNLGRTFHRRYAEWENHSGGREIDKIDRAAVNPNPAERRAAYKLRVDAYSTNSALLALLRALANEGRLANLPAGEFLTPVGHTVTPRDAQPAWGERWANPGGKSWQAEKFLRDDAGDALRQTLATFYRENLQLDAAQAPLSALLANRSYTAREQVYIAWYLAQINARNTADALNYLSLAPTAFRAEYNVAQLEMLHAIHGEYAPVRRFAALQNQLGAITANRELLVVPLWDHARERANVRNLLAEIDRFGENYDVASKQLWFAGDADEKVIEAAREHQISAKANAATAAIFRFTTLRSLTYSPAASDEILVGALTAQRDEAVWRDRTERPTPVFKMALKPAGGGVKIINDPPWWNGRLAIEKKLPPPPAALNESGSPTGRMPPGH
ncbi:hypothetical protein AGMMS49959_09140 [Planctomycetales bacterium]|nr:hypothetical protein AGMMS49959_09140 [Planctomycetales bacterium]